MCHLWDTFSYQGFFVCPKLSDGFKNHIFQKLSIYIAIFFNKKVPSKKRVIINLNRKHSWQSFKQECLVAGLNVI